MSDKMHLFIDENQSELYRIRLTMEIKMLI